MTPFRCGIVALIGRPNAGKSTLLNQLLGDKLAIISSKPQTTRDRVAGIHTDEVMQAILVDTPGVHKAWTELNKVMVQRAREAVRDADVALWLEDMTLVASRLRANQPAFDEGTEEVLALLREAGRPVVFVPNKIDVVAPPLVLPAIDAARQSVPLAAAVPLSALTGDGVGDLKAEIARHLPEGPALFPADMWTEASERFLAGELIREKIFHLTEQEVPYATAVHVEQFDESERETRGLVRVHATITVERPAQKAIVIGKGGAMLKRVGTLAREDLQRLLGCRVHLELFVKVERDWSRSAQGLRRVGYGS